MLDLVFKGQTFFDRVAWSFPMVCASCVRVILLWEMRLVDLPGRYHSHQVGDEGRQKVFVRHWDRGEFWNWPQGKVPHHIGTGAKVGIAGQASRGWSRSLGASLWMGASAIGCTGAELEEFSARAEKLG